MLSTPLRDNVVMLVPPPEKLSSKVEVLLEPFINDMRTNNTHYLILVRGISKGTRVYLHLLKSLQDMSGGFRKVGFFHRNTTESRKKDILEDLKLPLASSQKRLICVVATVSLGTHFVI